MLRSPAVTGLTQEQNCEIMQLVHKPLSLFGNFPHPHQGFSRYPLNARASHSGFLSSRILSPSQLTCPLFQDLKSLQVLNPDPC